MTRKKDRKLIKPRPFHICAKINMAVTLEKKLLSLPVGVGIKRVQPLLFCEVEKGGVSEI